MMTSSNGNIFRVTDPLCEEFTGHRWIPRTKASDAELWCFLWTISDAWINCWVNNRVAGDLRRYRAHYDVTVMQDCNIRRHQFTYENFPVTLSIYPVKVTHLVLTMKLPTKLWWILNICPYKPCSHMMTPSNGNIFRVTDPLCGEFNGHRWIPRTKASDAELWCFLWTISDAWINCWVNNRVAGDLRRYRAHYDVTVMQDCNIRRHQFTYENFPVTLSIYQT